MRLRILLCAGLCVVAEQAHAGLFSDDEARQRIQKAEARVSKLEEIGKQQAETNKQQAETNKQQAETSKQQTRSIFDLQTQIEMQNAELRSLRGQNEELVHDLRDLEKRQKDFYIDLDTRIRRYESAKEAAAVAPPPPPPAPAPDKAGDGSAVADDVVLENRAYEAAHGFSKSGNYQKAINAFQEFLKKFPESVYIPNAYFETGNAYFALKDYKNALANYQILVGKYSFSPKVQDAMLGIADCQQELKDVSAATKTLKRIIAKYPGSETASEAKKRLSNLE